MGMKAKSMGVFPRKTGCMAGMMAAILIAALALMEWTAAPLQAQPAWSKQPDRGNQGDVEFTLTPRDVSEGRFRVDVVVSTHGGNLADLDLMQAAELRVDGRVLHPLTAPALRGHHSRGRLEFGLDRIPEAFEIVIGKLPAGEPLTFRWP
jgi:hypothetical protein